MEQLLNRMNKIEENYNRIKEIVETLTLENKDLKAEIHNLRNVQNITAANDSKIVNQVKSYASITKSEKENVLIIKPKHEKDCTTTKSELKKNIKPAELKVAIEKVNINDKGKAVIKCINPEDIIRVSSEVVKTMGKDYEVLIPKERRPKIKIVGMEEQLDDNELIKCLKEQNRYIKDDADLKVLAIKRMKVRFFAIVECDPASYRDIMQNGVLFIGFAACTVFEYVKITRCFNCTGFYHISKYCNKSVVCMKCGGNHKASDNKCIPGLVNCPNCCETNKKYSLKLDTDHAPYDQACNIYSKHLERERNQTSYHYFERNPHKNQTT